MLACVCQPTSSKLAGKPTFPGKINGGRPARLLLANQEVQSLLLRPSVAARVRSGRWASASSSSSDSETSDITGSDVLSPDSSGGSILDEAVVTKPPQPVRLFDEKLSLPDGVELSLWELQDMATRQQEQIESQHQILVAKEQRLRYLKHQEAKSHQVAAENERLRRLKERVEAQELKLRKLRALRGQVDQDKISNNNLTSDLDSIRALFNEKEKELSLAVAKVEELTRQLEDLKRNGRSREAQPPTSAALELDKLRRELLAFVMGDRNGYNNPAFCNHMDLYDYQYVPEIDPDSPVIGSRRSYLVNRQVPPRWDSQVNKPQNNNRVVVQCNSSSDDSNGSIIVEERNNRRVTLICEKRPKVMRDEDGGYVHDISIESTEGDENRPSFMMSVTSSPPKNKYKYPNPEDRRENKRPQRQYERNRYEEISDDDDPMYQRSHRYAQIDEHLQTEGVHLTRRKPRAPTPEYNRKSTPRSSPFTSNFVNSPNYNNAFNDTDFRHTSSPIDCSNSFEMSDFSPPRNTIQRQPPVGASESYVAEPIEKPFIQRTKSENVIRSPYKNNSENKVLMSPRNKKQILRSNNIINERDGHKQSARRNISASFDCQPRSNSPYKPTTRALSPRSTAVVTPILSRKFAELPDEKFEKVSRMFQSTLNVTKNDKHFNEYQQNNLNILPDRDVQIKRNKSVPNFDSYHDKSSFVDKKNWRLVERRNDSEKFDTNSPLKSPANFSPLNKSRASLLDTVRSFSSYDEEWTPRTSPCLILSAVVQLIAGIVAGVICFYLLSKLGRRYFLDLGTIASFISMVLGGLGFRSHRWKWLPNRNYLSGYFMLGVFSVLNAGSLMMIVTIRPMAGDPIMDICAGAICAVSTIIIGISLIGLTMSGCCKTPPPDNRVTSA